MTKTQRWIVASLFLLGEALIIVAHPQEAKAVIRTVYQTLWHYTPKPDGFVPPDRFR